MRLLSIGRLGVAFVLLGLVCPGMAAQDGPDTTPQTLDLVTAWQLTEAHDSKYQAAISKRKAGQTRRGLERSKMLPQISANFGRKKHIGELKTPNGTQDLDYTSRTNKVSLNQTLLDWGKISAWRKGLAQADKSLAVFDSTTRDITSRLINRYLQVLLTHRNVTLAKEDLASRKKDIDIAQKLRQSGQGTVTDVQEAKSQHALAHAALIKSRTSLAIARRQLQEMIGLDPKAIQGVEPKFDPQPLKPASLEGWLARARQNNPSIEADSRAKIVSERKIDEALGQGLPSLDFVASYKRNHSRTISTLDEDNRQTSLGVKLEVPIFSGGKTYYQVRKAQHERDQSRHKLAATRDKVAVEITRHYRGVISGAEHVKALMAAVKANELTLKAMRQSYQGGARSISDILDAQDQLHETRRDLAKARLDYVKSRIKLKSKAGRLDNEAVIAAAQKWFGPNAVALH